MVNASPSWKVGETNAPWPPMVKGGLPWIWNTLQLATDPLAFFVDARKELGPVYRIKFLSGKGAVEFLFGREVTVIAGPETGPFMQRAEESDVLSAASFYEDNSKAWGAEVLPGMDGEHHRTARRLIGPGIAPSVYESRVPEAIKMTQEYARSTGVNKRFLVTNWVNRLVMNQLGYFSAGTYPGDYYDDILHTARTNADVTMARRLPPLAFYLPRYRRAKKRTFEFVEKLAVDHSDDCQATEQHRFVHDMLTAERKGMLPRITLLMPYISGHETVTKVMSFALYTLASNDEVRERVTAEVDDAFNDGPMDGSVISKLPLLNGFVQETLRLYPVALVVPRRATKTFEFMGYRIDRGQELFISPAVSHFLPEVYQDPYKFNLDRFSEDRPEYRRPGVYGPYGLGSHTCLGRGFADIQLTTLTAGLLQSMRFEMDPPDYQLKTQYASSMMPKDFYLKIREFR